MNKPRLTICIRPMPSDPSKRLLTGRTERGTIFHKGSPEKIQSIVEAYKSKFAVEELA